MKNYSTPYHGKDAWPKSRTLTSPNPNMVARQYGSFLGPTHPRFLPSQGPFSYSHAAGYTGWTDNHPDWKVVPQPPELHSKNKAGKLRAPPKNREYRVPNPPTTMIYPKNATPNNGPYNYRRGSRSSALCHNPARRHNKNYCNNQYKYKSKGPNNTFGKKLLAKIGIPELEKAILKELNISSLPCMRLTPRWATQKINREIQDKV